MTPDEVVGVLKVLQEGWVPFTKGAKYPVEHQALTSAISLIQDYQKLRERVSVEKIAETAYSYHRNQPIWINDSCFPWIRIKKAPRTYKQWVDLSQAIITYLQQPTEH